MQHRVRTLLLAAALPIAPSAAAQAALPTLPLTTVGGGAEEAARTAALRGEAVVSPRDLLRSASALTRLDAPAAIWALDPELRLVHNSAIPFGPNDGVLWAGRGASMLARAGIAARAGSVRLILAPEFVFAANAGFVDLVPPAWNETDPHDYLPPWQVDDHSIDLPYRMGAERQTRLHPGQSALFVEAGPLAAGAATENHWWGPGIRNALLLSNNAPGFGHLFLRTARPLETPAGRLEARWISGALRDSEWYARSRGVERGWRSFSAAAVALAPSRDLAVGAARTVHSPAAGPFAALGSGARVFTRWRREPDPDSDRRFEQILALWGRLLVPGEGAEVYVEWARTRLPSGLRDLAETPEHTQGYTIGLQWLRPAGSGDLRLQAEHTYVEESPTFRWRSGGSWYTSELVPQGYTHEGQVLGAWVGPGGSGQWAAVDWLRGPGRAGIFAGRVRWSGDAYYDKPGGHNRYLGHDVSMFGGLRSAMAAGPVRVEAAYTLQKRWNYLFQSRAMGFHERHLTRNVVNHTFQLGLTTGAPRLGPIR
jgi:hypothetical protein